MLRCGAHKLQIPAPEVIAILAWSAATARSLDGEGCCGTISFAGETIPIVDIAARGGAPAQTACSTSVIAVIDVGGSFCGLLASNILAVYQPASNEAAGKQS